METEAEKETQRLNRQVAAKETLRRGGTETQDPLRESGKEGNVEGRIERKSDALIDTPMSHEKIWIDLTCTRTRKRPWRARRVASSSCTQSDRAVKLV
eukprot:4479105-Pleurochrysis_carterae.AAC.1